MLDESKHSSMRTISIFVIMPFSEGFSDVFTLGIRPIYNQFPGWEIHVLRADTANQKHSELWSHVRALVDNCDLVIVDVTGHNPNVMLELGFALALPKDAIIITQEVPSASDLRGHIYLKYSPSELSRLKQNLIARVSDKLESIVESRSKAKTGNLTPGRSIWHSPPPKHRLEIPTEASDSRDLGFLYRERGELEKAAQHFRKATTLLSNYWEAEYDLALTLSLQKYEEEAQQLARKASSAASDGGDDITAWKCHNLLSGIHKRAGHLEDALTESRISYELSHRPSAIENGVPHVVPIKNRAALEFQLGHTQDFSRMVQELRNHPHVNQAASELEKEIGQSLDGNL